MCAFIFSDGLQSCVLRGRCGNSEARSFQRREMWRYLETEQLPSAFTDEFCFPNIWFPVTTQGSFIWLNDLTYVRDAPKAKTWFLMSFFSSTALTLTYPHMFCLIMPKTWKNRTSLSPPYALKSVFPALLHNPIVSHRDFGFYQRGTFFFCCYLQNHSLP